MRLKTVKVHGFKTFANPTEFSFQDGITAIVGPNGCGKSNIADAIRWALGEQSPSNLRTKKTEDLIFTGSATRPKMGMAQVELTLENPFSFEPEPEPEVAPSTNGSHPDGAETGTPVSSPQSPVSNLQSPVSPQRTSIVEEILRVRPHEVTILRRAYRSGENEYLINRHRVRLRDVQELLQRWGLARLTYAVIGQGLIDQALSLRAEERRSLFEEAAGIGLYQNKKANALEKLEETQQNLIRVNDIINEIAPRLPSLARQADRAGKYESVATALNANLKQWYAYNWRHAQEGFITAADQEAGARMQLEERRGIMQDLAAQLTEARRTAQTLRARLAEHRRARQQSETEFAARERELAVILERVRFAETQHADAQQDLAASVQAVESATLAVEQFPAEPVLPEIEEPPIAQVEPLGQELPIGEALLEAEPTIQETTPALEALGDPASLAIESETVAQDTTPTSEATSELTSLSVESEPIARDTTPASEAVSESTILAVESAPITQEPEPEPAVSAPDPFVEIQAQHNAEIQALAEKQRRLEAEHEAQIAKIGEAEAQAQAQWSAESERLVAAREQAAAEQRAQFEQQTAKLTAEREQAEYERARALARQRLAALRLAEFDTSGEYGTLAGAFSPELPDLAAHLIALQDKLPLYESALAAVAGLAAQADDLARRERELRERERLAERVRQEANEAKAAMALVERDVQTARQTQLNAERERERAERERAREQERAQRERQLDLERAREQFQRQRESVLQERERRRAEHAQQLRERELLLQEWVREQEHERQREQEREQARVRELERERQRELERIAEHRREQERERQRELERLAERKREQERERERELERLAGRRREQERERERIQREHVQQRERLLREQERALREQETKAARVATFAAQISEITTARQAARSQVDLMRAELQTLAESAFPDEAALNDSERLQNELEEREAELRSGLTVAEELYNRAVLEAERRRAEIARLEQEIEDDLGPVELDSAAPRQLRLRLVVRSRSGEQPSTASALAEGTDATADTNASPEEALPQELVTLPEVDALPDGFDKEIRRLKNQMRYIGNVNPNAPQEYAELKERHAFLTEQALDLTQAIEKLQQATAELDTLMKSKFQETFDAINAQFKNYFSMLFGGGSARLELTDPNDLIHSGIDISTRPPGKRSAPLVLLSGGERALTAAALIFSILKVSPTPFCVMDEVDAALDEANVGRFREGLKELSDASQFIVITHNRVTMEGARAIYGVSMGEDGVSQVLSLKLEQATANAR